MHACSCWRRFVCLRTDAFVSRNCSWICWAFGQTCALMCVISPYLAARRTPTQSRGQWEREQQRCRHHGIQHHVLWEDSSGLWPPRLTSILGCFPASCIYRPELIKAGPDDARNFDGNSSELDRCDVVLYRSARCRCRRGGPKNGTGAESQLDIACHRCRLLQKSEYACGPGRVGWMAIISQTIATISAEFGMSSCCTYFANLGCQ